MKPLYVKKNGVVYRVSGTGIPSIYPAANVEYDNTVTSELQATDVQSAIDELSTRQDTSTKNTAYGTCDTAGNVKDKVATLSNATNWVLEVGTIVGIRFTYTNTFTPSSGNAVTLNVNNTGAKNIRYGDGVWSSADDTKCPTAFGEAGQTIYYMYDGTYWVWVSHSEDNDTLYNFVGREFRSCDFQDAGLATGFGGDANLMVVNGVYYYNSNGPSTSIGASANDGSVFVHVCDDGYVVQIAQNYETGNIFVRAMNDNVWSAWKKPDAGTINGLTVQTAVPANAVFTDTNTTYTFAGGTNKITVTPSGGTAQDVPVTPSIANNVTGSGTNGYLAKFNGTNTVTNGPAIGSDTTKYLRNDGTWQVPPDTNTTYTFAGGTNKITVTPSGGTAQDVAITASDSTKLPLAGGNMTGAGGIQFPTASGSSKPNNYISAGGGYSAASGKSGVKLIVCEQSDCVSGLGQDCGGGPYELSVITGANTDGSTRIRFLKHTVAAPTTYTKLAELDGNGNFSCTSLNGVTIGSSPKFTDTTYNFAGTTFVSGGSGAGTHDANNVSSNGSYWINTNAPTSTANGTYANDSTVMLFSSYFSNLFQDQIAMDSYNHGALLTRSMSNGSWSSWYNVFYGCQWTATVKANTWSRICYVTPRYATEGSSAILAITGYRGSYVTNNLFLISINHNNHQYSNIKQINGGNYSQYEYRFVSNSNGYYYIELKDISNQSYHCSFLMLSQVDITTYTSFTDGTTVPTNFTASDVCKTNLSARFSNAEGNGSSATGLYSHAEGNSTSATGNNSHSEGYQTIASGQYSHAEGQQTTASGAEGSHAEGNGTSASGTNSHAEGYQTKASGNSSHAEGVLTTAVYNDCHAEGRQTSASQNHSHAEGYMTTASGLCSHSEGYKTQAHGSWSHAEGEQTTASNDRAHAEGGRTLASGTNSHAEGQQTSASGGSAHTEGSNTTASGNYSHAEGMYTIASEQEAHAEGYSTCATNSNSHSSGHYNVAMTTGGTYYNTTGTAFVIGNGTAQNARSNAFSVQFNGVVKAASTITASTTADYAEYFEWADENPNNEDRVGYFVTFDDGNEIRFATSKDDYILGVTSGEPFVLGNGDCDVWNGMVLRDEFRRVIYEPTPDYIEIKGGGRIPHLDKDGNPVYNGTRPKLNPNYDPSKPYVNRADRPEWCPVGMLGVLAVRDDGTCEVNGYATITDNAIATKYTGQNQNKYRVIRRNTQNVVEIVFR